MIFLSTLLFIVDSEKCTVFLYGENFVQIGKCCTVVKVKVNEAVIEWLEENKANQATGNKISQNLT